MLVFRLLELRFTKIKCEPINFPGKIECWNTLLSNIVFPYLSFTNPINFSGKIECWNSL